MELREYAFILRKNWIIVLLSVILGLGAGAGGSLLVTPEYQSNTQLIVSVRSTDWDAEARVQGTAYSRQIVRSYVAVVKTGAVLDPVVEELQLDMNSEELASRITVISPEQSGLINIIVIGDTAEQAAAIAGAVGESLKEVVRTQLEPAGAGSDGPVRLTTTQIPPVPEEPVSPNIMFNLALGLLLGIVLGTGIAVLRSTLDRRIYSGEDIEDITDKPILGQIIDDPEPERNRIVFESMPQSSRADSFRTLRTNLQFLNVDSPDRVFVVSSPSPGESKSTTALNLAYALAEAGSRVVAVEGDLRLPSFSEYLGIEGAVGLSDVLIGRAALEDVVQRWGRNEFFVLPAGKTPPNPSELLGSTEMAKLLGALGELYDYVIIDAPPILAVTDAALLGARSTGLLMVVATGSTTKQELTQGLKVLENTGSEVLGMVISKMPSEDSGESSEGGDGRNRVDELVDG